MAILIEKQTVNEYLIRIIKNDKPILGGLYQTELVFNNRVINSKDGLNLDAAFEVFKNTIQAILTHKLNTLNS